MKGYKQLAEVQRYQIKALKKAQKNQLDSIGISAAGFGGDLVAGALNSSQFGLGTDQRFICDGTNGALYFDQDGSGTGFAQIEIVGLGACCKRLCYCVNAAAWAHAFL